MLRLDPFTRGYINAALWNSTDESLGESGPRPLAYRYSQRDLSRDTIAIMIYDCAEFQAAHAQYLGNDLEHAGVMLWITRNDIGPGYWSADYDGAVAERLTLSALEMGEVHLFIDENNQVCSRRQPAANQSAKAVA